MDWKTLGQELVKFGLPLLGAALPVPGGAAFGAALAATVGSPSSKPEDILATLAQDAQAVVQARQFEMENKTKLIELAYAAEAGARKADSADIATVNATMQAEVANAASEAWYQKAWRPFCGFSVGMGAFVSTLFVCFLFYRALVGHDTAAITIIPQMADAIATILAVPGAAVGIAAWHRGVAQRLAIQANAPPTTEKS